MVRSHLDPNTKFRHEKGKLTGPDLQRSKRKAVQSGYVGNRSVTLSRVDGDACLLSLQNPHLGAHLSWVSHQTSGTMTCFFQAQLFYVLDVSSPACVASLGPLSFLNSPVHAHYVCQVHCLYTLEHEWVLTHYPQILQARVLLNSVFWNQNKGQFPRHLWESCLLVIVSSCRARRAHWRKCSLHADLTCRMEGESGNLVLSSALMCCIILAKKVTQILLTHM